MKKLTKRALGFILFFWPTAAVCVAILWIIGEDWWIVALMLTGIVVTVCGMLLGLKMMGNSPKKGLI